MRLDEARANALQLAELLENVLKMSGHLNCPAKDVAGLIKIAGGVVEAGPQPAPVPVVIVSLDGGTIVESYGSHPARVIFLDGDTEGGDDSQVAEVFGEDKYVTDGMVDVRPRRVAEILEELAAHAPQDEDSDDDGESNPARM
jgi:hypothetical protein